MRKMLVLLLAYAIAPAVAGHGVAPMAAMLLPVRAPEAGQVLGWAAIAVLVYAGTGRARGARAQPWWCLAGAVLLYLSWLCLVLAIAPRNGPQEAGTALESMILLAAPFQLTFVVVVGLLMMQLMRARGSDAAAGNGLATGPRRRGSTLRAQDSLGADVSRTDESSLVAAVCPACSAALDTPYIDLGASRRCATCGKVVVPRVTGVSASRGASVNFATFVKLLDASVYGERPLQLVTRWFPDVRGLVQTAARPAAGSAEEAALLRIHRQIQADSARQGQFYNVAMDLLR